MNSIKAGNAAMEPMMVARTRTSSVSNSAESLLATGSNIRYEDTTGHLIDVGCASEPYIQGSSTHPCDERLRKLFCGIGGCDAADVKTDCVAVPVADALVGHRICRASSLGWG